jgi:transposase-like protein
MTRKKFSKEVRLKAVEEFTSGAKTASEIAGELGTIPQTIYRWKTVLADKAKGVRLDELISEGNSREQAKKIQIMEFEMEAYQKKIAEQSLIIDLLKKLPGNEIYQCESELTGLINTTKGLDQKRRRRK